MSHDIYQDRRMFFTGATPWHNLGVKLPQNATWEEAKAAAGFYDALERPLYTAGIPAALPDVKALVASDDGRYLSTVGVDYGVIQFSEMAKAVIEAAGGVGAIFTTGGLLGDRGETGWLLGELPMDCVIKGQDRLRPYFLAYSGHDGRTALTLANCTTRVVCRNTVGAALQEKGGFRYSIRHTANAAAYVTAAAHGFKELGKSYKRLEAWGNLAAETRISSETGVAMLDKVYPRVGNKERIDSIHDRILDLYENHEVPETKGTAWAMFNALQGYAEHFAPTRARLQLGAMADTKRAAMIAERSFFGAGATGSQDALQAVCSVAGLPMPGSMAVVVAS